MRPATRTAGPIRPDTPIFDVMVYLAAFAADDLAAAARHLRLPARAAAPVRGGPGGGDPGRRRRRASGVGVGSGWSRAEWDAAGVALGASGARLDEILDVLRGLWTEEEFGHDGEHFTGFPPWPSSPSRSSGPAPRSSWAGSHPRRCVVPYAVVTVDRHAPHPGIGAGAVVPGPRAEARPGGRHPVTTTVAAHPGEVDVAGWASDGVDRVIVAPWRRSPDALDGMRRFADAHLG